MPDKLAIDGGTPVRKGPLKMGQAPGTHWYHAHKHGSTALNVANSMTGAFIIEGASYDGALNSLMSVPAPPPARVEIPDRHVQELPLWLTEREAETLLSLCATSPSHGGQAEREVFATSRLTAAGRSFAEVRGKIETALREARVQTKAA